MTNSVKLSSMIDHTLLKATATTEQIEKLCQEAAEYHFASVCVNPVHVKLAASKLNGTGVKVCTVIGFPLGANTSAVKAFEAKDAIANGAQEIDMVIDIGAMKQGNKEAVYNDIKAVREASKGTLLKVIIEACYLTDEEKVAACELSKKAGADFVKTSTGFGTGGAIAADIALMRKTVGAEIGVKASGGIRDAAAAQAMVEAGANRIGCSAGVAIAQSEK